MTQACDLSALEARRLIGAKVLSPVELLQSCEQRIAERNGEYNAFVALDLDAAHAAARAAEDDVANGRPLGLLHGLPIGVKDMELTKGLRTTWGALIHKDFVPDEDDLHIRRLRAAGGIVIGKTNVPEFGAGSNTVNAVYGATGNPFDSTRTCGGSSGGSAVALAAGMAPLATGSDFGGSLRTPAAFCGVVGFRPSPGLIPFPSRAALYSPMTVLGPMARSVADAHLMLMAQVGPDRSDPLSCADGLQVPSVLVPADLSTLRAAFSVDLGCAPVDAAVAQLFEERTGQFQHVFRSHEKRDPEFEDALEVFEVVRGLNLLTSFGEVVARHRDTLGPNVISGVELGRSLTAAKVAHAQLGQSRIYKRFTRFFDEVDVLICPATAVSPFPHALLYPDTINGVQLPTYMSWYAITYLLSLALPSIVCLPCGLDRHGMPFGIQVIGPMGSDARVLSIAAALEQELARHPQTQRPVPAWTSR